MSAMRGDGGRQIHERVEILQVAGPGNRQQTLNRAFAVVAAGPGHDFPPLHRGSERALGGVVRGLDAVFVDESEEMLVVHEQRSREVADVGIGGVEVPLAQAEERLLDREGFRDQLLAGQGSAPRGGIPSKPMPHAKQPTFAGRAPPDRIASRRAWSPSPAHSTDFA